MVKFRTQPAPTLPSSVQEALEREHPLVKLIWNPRALKSGESYEGRWEIWVQLADNTHEHNRFVGSRKDLRFGDQKYRFLQTWCQRDRTGYDQGFAPIDHRLLRSLALADSFANRRWYEDNVELPEEDRERRAMLDIKQAAVDTQSYYRNLFNPTVGARGRSADWRHRIR